MSSHVVFWIICAVVFAVAEAATTQLVGIWFAAGALIALIFASLSAPLWLQITAFAVSAALLLALTRPLVHRYLAGKMTPTNSDRAIGQTALVMVDIGGGAVGQVKVNGLIWSAVSDYDGIIGTGEYVTVRAIDGVKLIVEKIYKEEVA